MSTAFSQTMDNSDSIAMTVVAVVVVAAAVAVVPGMASRLLLKRAARSCCHLRGAWATNDNDVSIHLRWRAVAER